MNTLTGTATRQLGLWSLAALGFALAFPAQAAPDLGFMDGSVLVAARTEPDEEPRQQRRGKAKDVPREASRDEREDARGYGYGYERREHQRSEDGGRQQGRSRN